jgi:hypothetical protein
VDPLLQWLPAPEGAVIGALVAGLLAGLLLLTIALRP